MDIGSMIWALNLKLKFSSSFQHQYNIATGNFRERGQILNMFQERFDRWCVWPLVCWPVCKIVAVNCIPIYISYHQSNEWDSSSQSTWIYMNVPIYTWNINLVSMLFTFGWFKYKSVVHLSTLRLPSLFSKWKSWS